MLPLWAALLLLLPGCRTGAEEREGMRDYRKDMRDFVIAIAEEARIGDPEFLIIPQNGQELAIYSGDPRGERARTYLDAIDGTGREDLNFGYVRDDRRTPETDRLYMKSLCDLFLNEGKTVLVTDYCRTPSRIDESYSLNGSWGYLSFAADDRNLNRIPSYPPAPAGENVEDITGLRGVRNFLYLINPEEYPSREAFLQALGETNYDLLIIDLFCHDQMLTPEDIATLKHKKNGGRRLLVCYMSIGEAESYRFYWREEWNRDNPPWLREENPHWKGNFKVEYWNSEWQEIIFGRSDSYLTLIRNAGFDGVYLDIIDGFEYFEEGH